MSFLHNNDTIKIIFHLVNPGTPLEDGTKTYNVTCYLGYFADNGTEPYAPVEPVTLDGLLEKELNFKEYYKRLMALPRFEGSEKI